MTPATQKASTPLNESELASIKCLLRAAADHVHDAVCIAEAASSPQHAIRFVILRRYVTNEIEDIDREIAKVVKQD